MIRLQMHADGLARSHFAMSPLGETVNLVLAAAGGTVPRPMRGPLRDAVQSRRLDLLAALLHIDPKAGHYVPDFLTPPAPRFESAAEDELHAVATTPAWRVAAELGVVAHGHASKVVGRGLPRPVAEALDDGEARIAERLAHELEQVWTHVLAPQWPRLRARMESDIMLRLRTVGEHGFATAINRLNPSVDWHDGAVRVHSRFETTVPERFVTLLPSMFATTVLTLVDTVTCDLRRAAMVFYPVAAQNPGRAPEPPRPGELIGETRARILAATQSPATTGEVASRLRLSPSTVSYHLQILHRAGLVRRTRDSRTVLYQTT